MFVKSLRAHPICLSIIIITILGWGCSNDDKVNSRKEFRNQSNDFKEEQNNTDPSDADNRNPTPTPNSNDPKPSSNPEPLESEISAATFFSSEWFFNQDISSAAVDSQSSTIISQLETRGGWGNTNRFQIDFSIDLYFADDDAVYAPFMNAGMYLPDSDVPATIPVPATGNAGFESNSGTTCDGGDCHYLVLDSQQKRLYEGFVFSYDGSTASSSGSLAVWDYKKTYPENLRGDVCTSADAGGLPIAPLLFTPEEIQAGEINHAIRFILPNLRIQCRTYVRPASHGTGPSSCSGWASSDGVPYGARFRLKSDFPIESLPSKGAKVVARALQKYGMILADGGQIALTAKSDRHSTIKWSSLMGPHDLRAFKVTDFEMVEAGQRYNFSSYDCVRTNP